MKKSIENLFRKDVFCTQMDKVEVAYALEELEKRIFVATYQTKLPSDEKLKKAVRKLL